MWISPITQKLVPTSDSLSFHFLGATETGLPLHLHPGGFGFVRKHHTHEGVDLYCPIGTPVYPVEPGRVVKIETFTGAHATPPSPWWANTFAVLVEGESGVVVYGEIEPRNFLEPGDYVSANEPIGKVIRVLQKLKNGRPQDMLHLELHTHGTKETYEWPVNGPRPKSLLDPTPHLLQCRPRI